MQQRPQILSTFVLAALLLFGQWVSAEHSVEIDSSHIHGIDCVACVLEKQAATLGALVEPEPGLQSFLALGSYSPAHATYIVASRSIRAPPF